MQTRGSVSDDHGDSNLDVFLHLQQCALNHTSLTISSPRRQMQEEKQMERRKKIAVELSDLVVYCRPVPFNEDSKDQRAPSCSSTFFLSFRL